MSENPARAAGLADRGPLAPGKRTNIVLVDIVHGAPHAVATFVGGRIRN